LYQSGNLPLLCSGLSYSGQDTLKKKQRKEAAIEQNALLNAAEREIFGQRGFQGCSQSGSGMVKKLECVTETEPHAAFKPRNLLHSQQLYLK